MKHQEPIDRLEREHRGIPRWASWFRRKSEGRKLFSGKGKGKKVFGGFLVFVVCLCLLLPLVNAESSQYCPFLLYLNCGNDWSSYIVPATLAALLLLSPQITKVGREGIELAHPEVRRPESELGPSLAELKPALHRKDLPGWPQRLG